MVTKDYIKDIIPPLKKTDTVVRALQWMAAFRIDHLPVVDEKKYVGIITESELLKCTNQNLTLDEISPVYNPVFIYESQYIYDALQFISNHHLSVIPVLNAANNYMGLLTVVDVVEGFAQTKSVKTPGGIIIVHIPVKNFSFAEIANVVESNQGTILSSTVNELPDPTTYEVIIKINKIDLTRILAGFYRHNINVVASYNHADVSGDMQNRYDSFMSYLNV
jgi:acetoin utilization protein AcuB